MTAAVMRQRLYMNRPRSVIILAATRAIALRRATALGVLPESIVWPRTSGDLVRFDDVPLYVDVTLWDHPKAEELADYAGSRLRAAMPRKTPLARAS